MLQPWMIMLMQAWVCKKFWHVPICKLDWFARKGSYEANKEDRNQGIVIFEMRLSVRGSNKLVLTHDSEFKVCQELLKMF